MRIVTALALGAALASPIAAAETAAPQLCAPGQEHYWGECRPASVCAPGCFPQAIMCRDRPVQPKYDRPWAKFLDRERREVPLYNKRLDRGGLDQYHLAYLPDLNTVIGSHLSPKWFGLYWDIDLYVDEGADGTVDRAYRFDIRVDDAVRLFSTRLPEIIVEGRQERDPLSYLYGSLESFRTDAKRDVTHERQQAYKDFVAALEQQMCE
jgi:hypothetical protein